MYDEMALIWAVFQQSYASTCGNVMGKVTDLIFTGTPLPFLSVQPSEKFSLILRMIRVLEKNVMVS